MLVLSRMVDQSVMIGDDIEVMVTEIDYRRKKVKLGIRAPKGVRVDREEIYRKRQPNQWSEVTSMPGTFEFPLPKHDDKQK